MSQIAEQLKKAIRSGEKHGKTRYRLALESGVSQAQLSRLMSGQCELGLDSAERVARALGLELVLRHTPKGK